MMTTVLPVKSMRTVALICLLSLTALQVAAADDPVVDPPSRVARLSYIDGDVQLAPAGTEEWAEAVLNRPLTTGDRVWVDSGARAELQVGSASIHLDQGSGFSFVDLDDDLLHMNLTAGAVTIRVQRKRDNERLEIDTPNTTVSLLHPGEYHIEVTTAGETVVKTRSGESEVRGDKNSYTVRANEEGVFRNAAAGESPAGAAGGELTADIHPLGPRTAFEDWANERARRDENAVSARYVSREVIGYEDLDRDGEWISEAGYGYVWRPTYVVSGWAPYRYGRWVWVSPWGWNWVDDARWGFAPFHYGRWAYLRSRWCWVPGPRHIRPVYAPALVAWTGSPGFNVSVSFGSGVGWFPLGPREVYVPGYRYSRRYIHDVNVSNTIVNNTHITHIYSGRGGRFDYRYGHDPHAVTVVHRDRFVGGRPIDGHYSRADERDLRRWHHDARPPAIAPDRDSVLAGRSIAPRPPINSFSRVGAQREHDRFASRADTSRVSFDAERQAIEANGGRPVSRSQLIRRTPLATRQVNELARSDQAGSPSRSDLPPGREPSRDAQVDRVDRAQGDHPQANRTRPDRRADHIRGDEARTRTLNDRPAWARQQRDGAARHEPQQSVPMNSLRSDRSNASSGSAPSIAGEPRPQSTRPQWRGDNTPYGVQRETLRARPEVQQNSLQDSRSFRDRGDVRNQNEGRARERGSDRSWQQSTRPPQYSAPRAQPRMEQPRQQQPRVERSIPDRSTPERASRPQSNESRSGQSRSFSRPSPRE